MQKFNLKPVLSVVCILFIITIILNIYQIRQNHRLNQGLISATNEIKEKQTLRVREKEVRNQLDVQFYEIITALKNCDIPRLKDMINDNINIIDNELVIEDGIKDSLLILPIAEKDFIQEKGEPSLSIPREGYYFRQRYFNLEDNGNKFSTAYEIHIEGKDTVDVCYVEFVLSNGEWKLSSIAIDIG